MSGEADSGPRGPEKGVPSRAPGDERAPAKGGAPERTEPARPDRSEPAGPDRTQPAGPGRAGPPDVFYCDLCGAEMLNLHCKLICEHCGYKRDCSDP